LTPYGKEELEDSWEEGEKDIRVLKVTGEDMMI
jgi:N-acetylmuramic acid 6-phosphate (MurNAc-6-P) etherase